MDLGALILLLVVFGVPLVTLLVFVLLAIFDPADKGQVPRLGGGLPPRDPDEPGEWSVDLAREERTRRDEGGPIE
jgi:hypothetical protein